MNKIFSICVPTYNSEKTLRYTLESIKNQDFDNDLVEVLIIDGGSSDKTIEIAKEYKFAKILHNEKKLPEFAKVVGFNSAVGKYFITMDSDEAFVRNDSLTKRYNAFSANKKAKLLLADKLEYVKGYGLCGSYLNTYGEPFTYFIYRNKESISKTYKKNIKSEQDGICEFKFSSEDKKPIADGGSTTFDLDFLRKQRLYHNQLKDISFICSASNIVLEKTGCCLVVRDDNIYHRSKSELKTYLKKIKFRIINNVFAQEESGFSQRNIVNARKKYLFPFYCASVILPIIDAIKLTIKHKDVTMMMHVFYSFYTCYFICLYMFYKKMGITKTNKEY